MVPAGPQTIDLAIQHVRQSGQGVPVAGMAVRKDPGDALGREPAGNTRILGHVHAVIHVDEPVANRRTNTKPTASSSKPQMASAFPAGLRGKHRRRGTGCGRQRTWLACPRNSLAPMPLVRSLERLLAVAFSAHAGAAAGDKSLTGFSHGLAGAYAPAASHFPVSPPAAQKSICGGAQRR